METKESRHEHAIEKLRLAKEDLRREQMKAREANEGAKEAMQGCVTPLWKFVGVLALLSLALWFMMEMIKLNNIP